MGSDTSYKSPAARIFPTGQWNVAEPFLASPLCPHIRPARTKDCLRQNHGILYLAVL
jgi:hypothetical protein